MLAPGTLPSSPQGVQLDSPPARPPGRLQDRNIVDLSTGDDSGYGMESANPVIQAMETVGQVRQGLLKLASQFPQLAQASNQIIEGLQQAVPQLLADLAAGQTPGTGPGGAGMANQAPTAPPVSTGLP